MRSVVVGGGWKGAAGTESGGKEREERGLWRFKVKERLGGDRGERKVRRKRGR